MLSTIRFSLTNKFALLIMTVIVVAAGLYAGTSMKQETIPNINVPVLIVNTVYPGATPEEVAKSVTTPLENKVENLSGVTRVQSVSSENVSTLTIEYNYDVQMRDALTDLQEAVRAVTLPEVVDEPAVSKISIGDFPVITLSLGSSSLTLSDVTKAVTTQLQPKLEGVEGAGQVTISGQTVPRVLLTFDEAKLKAFGLTLDLIKQYVQGSAMSAPLGLFELDKTDKSVVVDGGIQTIEQLRSLPLPLPGITLGDVATLQQLDIVDSIARTNGEPSVGISITKASDANTVEVVNAVKQLSDEFVAANEGINSTVFIDQGRPIEDSVSTMLDKALFGALFAVVVILLFLRNFRTTIISVVSIPLSLLIALAVLHQLDVTLNIMTLGAMTVAIGRVVDDSIVVIENNYRRMALRTEPLRGMELITDATREMFIPILSSTLVTIAVFLPLGTVDGPIGEIFTPFALTIVFALLASLLVAITVVPMMTHVMFRRGLKGKDNEHHEERPGRLAAWYRRALEWSLNRKAIVAGSSALLLVASLFLVPVVGTSFLPEEPDKYALVTYSPGPGKLITDVQSTALQAEKQIMGRKYVTDLQYSVGGSSPFTYGPNNNALFYVKFESDTPNFLDVKKQLLKDLSPLEPSGTWGEVNPGGGIGSGGISLNVFGDSIDDIKPVAEQIAAELADVQGLEKIDVSLSKQYDQYTLVANQQALSRAGLTTAQLVMQLMPQRGQGPLMQLAASEGDATIDVIVTNTKGTFGSINDITSSMIATPSGQLVPISSLVTIEEGKTANSVTRSDGKLYVQVTANVTAKDVGAVSMKVQDVVAELKLPDNVTVDFGGVTEQLNDTFKQLGLAILAAIAIVYLLLVITFGGAITPFTILFSLPFTLVGALLGHLAFGETISAASMMGMLMLIGIVVTNAIVLIDRVLQMEKSGLSTREALLEAAGTRLRPILMTALATIGALLPLVLGFEGGSGGLISKGLGVTVIGGLTSSTVLTLLIVPIVFEWLGKYRRKKES